MGEVLTRLGSRIHDGWDGGRIVGEEGDMGNEVWVFMDKMSGLGRT